MFIRSFSQIPNRWMVFRTEGDARPRGVVEKHEFTTYEKDGARVAGQFWLARIANTGRRDGHAKRFDTQDEAVDYILGDTRQYVERREPLRRGRPS